MNRKSVPNKTTVIEMCGETCIEKLSGTTSRILCRSSREAVLRRILHRDLRGDLYRNLYVAKDVEEPPTSPFCPSVAEGIIE